VTCDPWLVTAGKVLLLASEVREGVPLGEEDEGSGPSAVTDDPLLFDTDISNVMVAASVQRLLQRWNDAQGSQGLLHPQQPPTGASSNALPEVRISTVQYSTVPYSIVQYRTVL